MSLKLSDKIIFLCWWLIKVESTIEFDKTAVIIMSRRGLFWLMLSYWSDECMRSTWINGNHCCGMLLFKLSRKLHLTTIQSQKVVEPLRCQKYGNVHILVCTCVMVLQAERVPYCHLLATAKRALLCYQQRFSEWQKEYHLLFYSPFSSVFH